METAILHVQRVKLNDNQWVIQDHSIETTINKLHDYKRTLLKEVATETCISRIEGKNEISAKKK